VLKWRKHSPTISAVNYNVLGQGIVGSHLGVDMGFILATVVALVVRVILDPVLHDNDSDLERSAA
jgi:hypothetical protein